MNCVSAFSPGSLPTCLKMTMCQDMYHVCIVFVPYNGVVSWTETYAIHPAQFQVLSFSSCCLHFPSCD
jgi:hypothetical protein